MSIDADMLICPYNRSHVVSKLRMARHLVKCQANYPNVFFATCFYDFLHRVPPEELDEHLKNCPSKFQFNVQFCTDEESANSGDPNVEKIFLTKKGLESAKRPEGRWCGGPARHSTATENRNKECTTSSSGFVLKYTPSDHKEPEQKGKKEKSKKSSKSNEESWDTESSEDGSEETQKGASASTTTTFNKYSYKSDSGSTHTDGSSSFQGDDSVDDDGFIKVNPKQKSKRRK